MADFKVGDRVQRQAWWWGGDTENREEIGVITKTYQDRAGVSLYTILWANSSTPIGYYMPRFLRLAPSGLDIMLELIPL